jgi:hypothetical protein
MGYAIVSGDTAGMMWWLTWAVGGYQEGHIVGRHAKSLARILSGRSDVGIRFSDLVQLLQHLGFLERTKGDHHIFTRDDVEEILNLQPRGAMAKPYQVKQVGSVILKYRLGVDENEQI